MGVTYFFELVLFRCLVFACFGCLSIQLLRGELSRTVSCRPPPWGGQTWWTDLEIEQGLLEAGHDGLGLRERDLIWSEVRVFLYGSEYDVVILIFETGFRWCTAQDRKSGQPYDAEVGAALELR